MKTWFQHRYVWLVYFAILLVLSLWFSKERMLSVDSSNFLYYILNYETFCFPGSRFGSLFTQLPTLFGAWLGWPIKVLLPLFSASFILWYALLFLICSVWLKNKAGSLVILLIMFLGIKHGFYHPVTETHQAMVYSALFFAVLDSQIPTKLLYRFLLALLIAMWALNTHPFAIFTIYFVIGYLFVSKQNWKSLELYILSVLIAIGFVLKIYFLPGGYDNHYYEKLSGFTNLLTGLIQSYPAKYLVNRASTIFLLPIVLIAFNLVFLLMKKQTFVFMFYVLFMCLFIVFNFATFFDGDADKMMERSYTPIWFMTALVFAECIYSIKSPNISIAWITLHVLLCFSIKLIIDGGNYEHKRINYLNEIISYQYKNQIPKLFLTSANVNGDMLFDNWAFPLDVMLLSKIKYPDFVCSAFIANNEADFEEALQKKDIFLTVSYAPLLGQMELNKKYFNLPEVVYYRLPNTIKL